MRSLCFDYFKLNMSTKYICFFPSIENCRKLTLLNKQLLKIWICFLKISLLYNHLEDFDKETKNNFQNILSDKWINSNLLYMRIKVHFTPLFIIGHQCEDINCNLYKRQDLH